MPTRGSRLEVRVRRRSRRLARRNARAWTSGQRLHVLHPAIPDHHPQSRSSDLSRSSAVPSSFAQRRGALRSSRPPALSGTQPPRQLLGAPAAGERRVSHAARSARDVARRVHELQSPIPARQGPVDAGHTPSGGCRLRLPACEPSGPPAAESPPPGRVPPDGWLRPVAVPGWQDLDRRRHANRVAAPALFFLCSDQPLARLLEFACESLEVTCEPHTVRSNSHLARGVVEQFPIRRAEALTGRARRYEQANRQQPAPAQNPVAIGEQCQ